MAIQHSQKTASPDRIATTRVVGLDRDPRHLARVLESGRSLVVTGARGVGKSFLVEHVTDTLRAHDHVPLVIHGSPALQNIDFGAFAAGDGERIRQLLGSLPELPNENIRSLQSDTALPIVVVDDAEYLDDATTDALVRLAYRQRIVALISMTPHDPAHPLRDDSAARHALLDLVGADFGERLDLTEMTGDDADALMTMFTASTPLDSVTRAAIYEWSAGSRLLLRELCLLATHAHARGDDPVTAHLQASEVAGIADFVRRQLSALPRDAGVALAVIGRVPGLSHTQLCRIVPPSAMTALVSARLVREQGSPVRRVYTHPTIGAIATSLLSEDELDRLISHAATPTATEQEAGVTVSPAASVELAHRWLRGEPSQVGRDFRDGVFLAAARASLNRGEHDVAISFAREALTGPHAGRANALLAACFFAAGDTASAMQMKDTWIAERPGSPGEALGLWVTVAVCLPSPTALPMLVEQMRQAGGISEIEGSIIDAGQALSDLLHLRVSAALIRASTVWSRPDAPTPTRMSAALIGACAATLLGRGDAAAECLEVAERLNRNPVTGWRESMRFAATILCVETLCRVLSGERVEVIPAKAADLMPEAVVSGDRLTLSMLGWTLGTAAQFRGDTASADIDVTAAEQRLRLIVPQLSHAVRAQRVALSAMSGDLTEARTRAAQLPTEFTWPLLHHFADRARMMCAGEGKSESEAAALAPALTGIDVLDLLDLYHLGLHDPAAVTDQLDALEHANIAPLAAPMARHIRGLRADDAQQIAEAAELFAGLQAFGRARRAYSDASVVAAAANATTYAATLASRAHDASARSVVNLLTKAIPPTSTVSLTPREREIAERAARGASNKEIAAALFISVRTVESHLHQAMTKLGAESRHDIEDTLVQVGASFA